MVVGDLMDDLTKVYNQDDLNLAYTKAILKEVIQTLIERGYNPINQIVGYLMSGDPGYITSFQDARSKISSIDRSSILEVLVKELMNK